MPRREHTGASGPFEAVIGLEIHCQLLTRSKAFSPDPAGFTAEPNVHVDPVSLGHPGTLPVLNARVVDFAIALGLATGCRIAPRSILARKHYFYPDLPKGYQISQYDRPICAGGHIEFEGVGGSIVPVGITRIHVEEDAGRSLHDADPGATLLDFNRCGVALVEIVTEPDLRSPADAARFMRRIRQVVRYLGISDGNMEEGSLRCDANVSVRGEGARGLGTKTEIKNLNSFRHVERALAHEISRQSQILGGGGRVVQETRLWDDATGATRPMRSKEEAHDYRYFPDPDLPPIVVTPERIERIRASLPEPAASRVARFVAGFGLPEYDAALLTEERPTAEYFEAALTAIGWGAQAGDDGETARGDRLRSAAKVVSNVVMSLGMRVANERSDGFAGFPIEPDRLAGLARLRLDDAVSSTALQELFDAMLQDPRPADEIAAERNLLQVSDAASVEPFVRRAVEAHPDQVLQYRAGKTGLAGFFIGQVMKSYPGSPDPRLVRRLVEEALRESV